MSRARTLAGAIGSDGALNVADVAGLAAIASSGSASDLSTGTLPIARIADGAVTSAKIADGTIVNGDLASGVAVANLGYTPPSRFYPTSFGSSPVYGATWCRLAKLTARWAFRVTVGTTGGWYSPGHTSFIIHHSWGNDIYVTGIQKVNSQYCTQVRATSAGDDGDWYLELYFNTISASSGNASTYFDHFAYMHIEPLGTPDTVLGVQTYAFNGSSLGRISNVVVL